MSDKILFVDDEPILLQGYQRLLRKEFTISTAVGGAAALLLIKQEGPSPWSSPTCACRRWMASSF